MKKIYNIDKRFIEIRFQREGLHSYPNAPDKVSFLRDFHRHLFKVKVKLQVWFNNREIEFFMLKERIEKIIDCEIFLFKHSMSCEDYAEKIMLSTQQAVESVKAELGTVRSPGEARYIRVTVSEDGENAAILEGEITV